MASDGLNQVGRYIRETRRDVDFALNRKYAKRPMVERTRDVFDSSTPFEMTFESKPRSTVKMDLFLNKPPPCRTCGGDCVSGACEEFTLPSGTSIVTLEQNYISGQIYIFVNGIAWLNYVELDSAAGQVQIGGLPKDSNTVTVCYHYDNCPIEYYTGSAFGGLLFVLAGDGGRLSYGNSSDNPPAGWYQRPYVGPMEPVVENGYHMGVRVLQNMTVRVEISARWVSVVSGAHSLTVWLRVDNSDIGHVVNTSSGDGLRFQAYNPYINIPSITVLAGSVVTFRASLLGNWGDIGTNGYYLNVGRGTHYWNSNTVTWVGAS